MSGDRQSISANCNNSTSHNRSTDLLSKVDLQLNVKKVKPSLRYSSDEELDDSDVTDESVKVTKSDIISANCSINGNLPPNRKDAFTTMGFRMVNESNNQAAPCEPGTNVSLEGIVWQETDGGVLVVNVTWREKSYVGTLLDCTKHDWAPPMPVDLDDSDTGKSYNNLRSKRGRNSLGDTYEPGRLDSKLRNGKGRKTFAVPSSPTGRNENVKRKGKDNSDGLSTKRSTTPSSPVLIECPEPNCGKKYKHINGLKYHQTHAHGERGSKKDEGSSQKEIQAQKQPSSNESNLSTLASLAALRASNAASSSASDTQESENTIFTSQANSGDLKDGALSNSGYSDISDEDSGSERELSSSLGQFTSIELDAAGAKQNSNSTKNCNSSFSKGANNNSGPHFYQRGESPFSDSPLPRDAFPSILYKQSQFAKEKGGLNLFKAVTQYGNSDNAKSDKETVLEPSAKYSRSISYEDDDDS